MRFRRILRFTMKILRNEDFAKISPGGVFADSRFVGEISRNEDFANSAETRRPGSARSVDYGTRSHNPPPVCIIDLPPSYA